MGCDIKAVVEYSFTESDGSKGFAFWNWVPLLRNYTLTEGKLLYFRDQNTHHRIKL
jgi:hypothetical protein